MRGITKFSPISRGEATPLETTGSLDTLAVMRSPPLFTSFLVVFYIFAED